MKRQFILVILIVICIISGYNPAVGQIAPGQIIDRFFELYPKVPGKAIDYIFSTNKWLEQKREDIDSLKFNLRGVSDSSGEYFGYVKIRENNSGENLKLISCYLRYDREPIQMNFFLYRPNDKWQLQNLSFDEVSLDNYLEEMVKLSILKEN